MTIYLDIVIIENIIMNYIILYATGIINKNEISIKMLLLASILGSAYSVITYLSIIDGFINTILKILLSIAMVYIAFRPKNYKLLFKNLLLFYLTSFTLGGCAFFLLYYIRPQDILIRKGVLVGTYPIKIAILGGIIGAIIITIAFKIKKGKITKKDMFYDLEIFFKEKCIKVRAMLDTGNLLKDPITGIPVIIVEKNNMMDILHEKIINSLEEIMQGKVNEFYETEYASRFRVIPFASLGKQNGMLLGFKPDKISLHLEEEVIEKTDIIIGIYEKALTKNGKYTALIGLDLIEGGKKNEHIRSVKV